MNGDMSNGRQLIIQTPRKAGGNNTKQVVLIGAACAAAFYFISKKSKTTIIEKIPNDMTTEEMQEVIDSFNSLKVEVESLRKENTNYAIENNKLKYNNKELTDYYEGHNARIQQKNNEIASLNETINTMQVKIDSMKEGGSFTYFSIDDFLTDIKLLLPILDSAVNNDLEKARVQAFIEKFKIHELLKGME